MVGSSSFQEGVGGILESSDRAFENPSNEVITRGLRPSEGTRVSEGNESYLDILPTYDGKDFIQILTEEIEERKKEGGGPVRILDIGGGAGIAMLDLRDEFTPEELEIVIIGNEKHTQTELDDNQRGVRRDSTANELSDRNINFIHTNFLRAHRDIGTRSFDVVVACYSLNWIDYSPYAIFKKVWRQLVPGGVAFLAPFSGDIALIGQKDSNVENLWSYLNSNCDAGIEMNGGGISFKRDDDVVLPTDIEHEFIGKRVRKRVQ